ncbi:MAG: hypothetical protein HGA31_01160 [Candidatus Moranbacteria bacterium]|nr:hypothetical protein [Candidatus Moranbacteria bacterium]
MDKVNIAKRLRQIQILTEECLSVLSVPDKHIPKARVSTPAKNTEIADLDFSTPLRAFIKNHSKGMSGQKKFTLILAHATKGQLSVGVSRSALERDWGKMKSILGSYNDAYSIRAKESDWVTSSKNGVYSLRPSWQKIFN